jgi:FemAB-related protein (PEP-CTERM system-associated)
VDLIINSIETDNCLYWDTFANHCKQSCLYHLFDWCKIIKSSYGHNTYYLIAQNVKDYNWNVDLPTKGLQLGEFDENGSLPNKLVGILPLFHIKHKLFGNSLISIPYFDSAGILADNKIIEKIILEKIIELAEQLNVTQIELRQNYPFQSCGAHDMNRYESTNLTQFINNVNWNFSISTNKVKMVLELPDSPETLTKSLKAKLRSQIRKPIKEGLTAKIGSHELVNDFYNVFAENMRDLGSPVHSKKFIAETLKAFSNTANVFIVYSDRKPLAGSVTIGFKDTLSNPWASSLRRYSHLAPNMLLYWSMLEFACQQGYKRFDFGRSTPSEGTYKFKEQWGAKPEPLYWYRFSKANHQGWGSPPDMNKMSKAIEYWKKLPVPLTKIIGPRIRKYISL